MTAIVVIEGVAIALLGLLVTGLLRSHAEILRQLHQMSTGTGEAQELMEPHRTGRLVGPRTGDIAAADIVGETSLGEVAAVAVIGVGHNTLLAFLSSNCSTCAPFWGDIKDPTKVQLPGGTRLIIVTRSADNESLSEIRKLSVGDFAVVMSSDAWTRYGVPGSPYFVLVDGPGGRVIGEGSAGRWSEVRSLMTQALDDVNAQLGRQSGLAGQDRADRVEAELLAAGIRPGHPSLYRTEPLSPPEQNAKTADPG